MADFTPADLDAIFKKYFGDAGPKSGSTPNNKVDVVKDIKAFTDELKKSQPIIKIAQKLIEGTTTPFVDVSGKLALLNAEIEKSIQIEKNSADQSKKDEAS